VDYGGMAEGGRVELLKKLAKEQRSAFVKAAPTVARWKSKKNKPPP